MQATFLSNDLSPHASRKPQTDRLILPELLEKAAAEPQLAGEARDAAHAIVLRWADLESSGKLARMKETQLRGEFLSEVFGRALRYRLFSENLQSWDLWQEFPVNGGSADAAIGSFAAEADPIPVAVIELKGPKADLDRDRSGGRTPVEQCRGYMFDLPGCRWGLVSNIVSFRLYHHEHPKRQYEHFSLQDLRGPDTFRQFYALFERGGLLPSIVGHLPRADQLLHDTDHAQQRVSDELYELYRDKRFELVRHLIHQHGKPIDTAIRVAQKLLDRILFVAFCEDRGLLPPLLIKEAWQSFSRFARSTNKRWREFLHLFESIDQGNFDAGIPKFNGRLFAHDPELDDGKLLDDRWTDFFNDIAKYDFKDGVHLDVLGHIFERSITDLELLRAESAALLATEPPPTPGRRKREGIYYTPPSITRYIVEHTVGQVIDERFAALAAEQGIDDPSEPPTAKKLADWFKFQQARLDCLRSIRVVDPACGSGAFLIQAFDDLEDRYDEVVTALGMQQGFKNEPLREQIKIDILTGNLFGVDLSEESVEITRLALWIRTAERGKTLADLSSNIQRGNSLVDDVKTDANALDWQAAFPQVFAQGGFDCVIGNPPYVKLQNFRRREPAVAAWLTDRYKAASTGNFDMYLPFIERGLELLRPGGRLGFIAPNVWLFNEYGRGLRELVAEKRALTRFVDFKSHQVFEDATTYTALQFFTTSPQEHIVVSDAGDGNLAQLTEFHVGYEGRGGEPWALLDAPEQAILDRMRQSSVTLADATEHIFQGIITSADAIYHLIKVGSGKYYSAALERIVELEDAIMKPLVSGEDASPFAVAAPIKFLLFPYEVDEDGARLITAKKLQKSFKRAWSYLEANEKALRARESDKFDLDEGWWQFGRSQALDTQKLTKIGVPQTVNRLQAFIDLAGMLCFNNVRVNGITERADGAYSLWYLLALLNARVVDFFFKRIAKPKDRNYFEANKQFIAPLPIPADKDQKPLSRLAEKLTKLHSARHEAIGKVHRRLVTDLPPKELVRTSPLPPKLPGRLAAYDDLAMPSLLAAMEGFAERTLSLEERDRWQDYLTPELSALEKLKAEIASLMEQLNLETYDLYGLSSQQIATIEAAAKAKCD